MFDPTTEKPIPLSIAAKLPVMPERHNGKTIHPSTLWRWATVGYRGIRLETIVMPLGLCTSEQAVLRFFERLSTPFASSTTPTPSQRRKSIARAEAVLQAAGI